MENFLCITNEQLKDCEPSEKVKAEVLKSLEGATIVGTYIEFMESFLGVKFEDTIELSNKLSLGNTPLGAFFRRCIRTDLDNITKEEI